MVSNDGPPLPCNVWPDREVPARPVRGLAVAGVRALAIDVLVNNAGVGYVGPVETIDIDNARALMETNSWDAVRTMRAVVPTMRARASGVIINVTSTAARVPGTAYNGWYGASKHALGALSEAMVMELDGFGVRVACIEPGFFSTDIAQNSAVRRSTDATDPYSADQAWMVDFYEKSVGGGGGDPVVVAEAIVRPAVDPAPHLHNLVGEDAVMFVDLVQQAGSLEARIPIGTSATATTAPQFPSRPSQSASNPRA